MGDGVTCGVILRPDCARHNVVKTVVIIVILTTSWIISLDLGSFFDERNTRNSLSLSHISGNRGDAEAEHNSYDHPARNLQPQWVKIFTNDVSSPRCEQHEAEADRQNKTV